MMMRNIRGIMYAGLAVIGLTPLSLQAEGIDRELTILATDAYTPIAASDAANTAVSASSGVAGASGTTSSAVSASNGVVGAPGTTDSAVFASNGVVGVSDADNIYDNYVVELHRKSADHSAYYVADSIFFHTAASVVFPVNLWDLNPNDPIVKELSEDVLPRFADQKMKLVAIRLRGAASPEGPYQWNVTLSRERLKSLLDFVSQHVMVDPERVVITSTQAEDYPYLCLLMKDAGDPDYELVEHLVSQGQGEPFTTKRLLQIEGDGSLWKRLNKEYFPQLRAARIMLFFAPEADHIDLSNFLLPSVKDFMGETPTVAPPAKIKFNALIERRHLLSVGTNVLYDAFWMPQYGWAPMPNVSVEVYPLRSNWTFAASFLFPYYHKWDKQKFFQIRDYHLEARRYFSPGLHHTGLYLGAYINANKYGIGLGKDKGWQGEGIGGALKIGYVLPLGDSRWRVDFHVAAGGYVTKYDPYVYGNPVTGEEDGDYYYDWTGGSSTFIKRNHRLTWFGPTEVGVTFTYDVLFWRARKPGASFLRYETIF